MWLYVEGNTIVRTREATHTLEIPSRLSITELKELCGKTLYPQEISYFHIVEDPTQTNQRIHPYQDTPYPYDIVFEPSLPVYHEYTTLYIM